MYNELLSHVENEVHFTPAGPLAGRTWEEAVFAFRHAIPIGIERGDGPLLAPARSGAGFRLLPEDHIIAVARNQQGMRIEEVRLPQAPPPSRASDANAAADAVPDEPGDEPVRNVLVLGWSEMVLPMLREYAGYARSSGRRFAVQLVSPCLPEGMTASEIADIIEAQGELDILLRRMDYLAPTVLEQLRPGEYDAIIVLDEAHVDTQFGDPDTRVIMTLLLLRSLRDAAERQGTPFPPRQQIVGEILDVNNKELVEATGTVRDVIISNDLISKMIAQVCRERRTDRVMEEFFNETGMEIYLKPAAWYAADGSSVRFDDLVYAALCRGEAAFGFARQNAAATNAHGEPPPELRLNPPRDMKLRIDAGLQLVVIAEQEGPAACASPGPSGES